MIRTLLAAFVFVATASCASNPVKTAAGALPEHKAETVAFALHNSFVVLAERVAAIGEAPDTPESVKRSLVSLYRDARPVVERLQDAAMEYNRVRAALIEGATTEEKVAAALSELQRLLVEAAPKVDALAREIGGAS